VVIHAGPHLFIGAGKADLAPAAAAFALPQRQRRGRQTQHTAPQSDKSRTRQGSHLAQRDISPDHIQRKCGQQSCLRALLVPIDQRADPILITNAAKRR